MPRNLCFEIALELQELSDGFTFFFSPRSVECPCPTEHCSFNLLGNDGTHLSKIFSDRIHLDCCSHQELEICFKVAHLRCSARGGVLIALSNKMVNLDLFSALAVPIDSTVSLFQPIWIPRDFKVKEAIAVIL